MIYSVQLKNRDAVNIGLRDLGVETGVHYPKALPYLKPYGYLHAGPKDYPVAFGHAMTNLSLPMYPELSEGQMAKVVDSLDRVAG